MPIACVSSSPPMNRLPPVQPRPGGDAAATPDPSEGPRSPPDAPTVKGLPELGDDALDGCPLRGPASALWLAARCEAGLAEPLEAEVMMEALQCALQSGMVVTLSRLWGGRRIDWRGRLARLGGQPGSVMAEAQGLYLQWREDAGARAWLLCRPAALGPRLALWLFDGEGRPVLGLKAERGEPLFQHLSGPCCGSAC